VSDIGLTPPGRDFPDSREFVCGVARLTGLVPELLSHRFACSNRRMTDRSKNDKSKISVNRPLVGIISLGCLITAIVLWVRHPEDDYLRMWVAGFVRAGLMTGAVWIALPTKNREAAWANVSPLTLIGGIVGIIAVAARPRVLVLFIPIFIGLGLLGFVLKPRGRRDNRPDRDSWK